MNILYLTNLYPPVVSGSSVQSRSLAISVAQKGHGCVIVTAHLDPDTPEYEERNGVHIYRLRCFRLPRMEISLNFPWLNALTFPGNFKRIREIAKKHDINIIHVHNHMFDAAFMGRRLSKQINIPMIVTIHTVITHLQRLYNLVLVPFDRYVLGNLIVQHAKQVICPDENVVTYLKERFGRPDGILIPYGIDLPEQSSPELQKELVEKYKLQGRKIMLSVGHLHALRNRISLIKSLPEIVKKHPDFLLLIVGSVTDDRAQNLVQELSLENHVIFTGTQPRAVVRELHDLCLFEGVWLDQDEEGMNSLGIAGMEAMYMGKALISRANIDTFGKEVLKFGENIYCLPNLDTPQITSIIMKMLDNPTHANDVGEKARKLATETFSWPQATQRTLDVYRRALGQKNNTEQMHESPAEAA